LVRCRKRRGGTPTGERAPPCLPARGRGKRDQGARPHPPMRPEGLRVCRRFAFLIYEPGAIEMDAGTTAGAGRRDRVRSFSFFVEQNSGANAPRERFAWSCERQRAIQLCARGWIASSRSPSSGRPFRAGPVGSSQCRAPMRRERASLHPLAAAFSHPGAPSRVDVERSPVAGQFERWSGRWDSNPRPQPWQGCALPLSYTRIRKRVRRPRPQPSYAKERQAWQPPPPRPKKPPPEPRRCPPPPPTSSPIWTVSASPTRPSPIRLHGRGSARRAKEGQRRTHQESVPARQEGRGIPRGGVRA
jgi:hypothetical protein